MSEPPAVAGGPILKFAIAGGVERPVATATGSDSLPHPVRGTTRNGPFANLAAQFFLRHSELLPLLFSRGLRNKSVPRHDSCAGRVCRDDRALRPTPTGRAHSPTEQS